MTPEDPILARAANFQEKFQLYLVALTFGILAISVQTATFEAPIAARIAELLGWLLLLASGIVGLWRLEWVPRHYQFIGVGEQIRERAQQMQQRKMEGEAHVHATLERKNYPIDHVIQTAHSERAQVEEALKPLVRKSDLKYKSQKVTFVLGLTALMVSRGLGPLRDIIAEIRN